MFISLSGSEPQTYRQTPHWAGWPVDAMRRRRRHIGFILFNYSLISLNTFKFNEMTPASCSELVQKHLIQKQT